MNMRNQQMPKAAPSEDQTEYNLIIQVLLS
jgi:hypothetical protein